MDSITLYRWEQSAGLEHACGRCGTKQHDPKARQSCFGIHTEPCPRYHQIMFFLGMSHNCYPCSLSNEQHEKRHIAVCNTGFVTWDVGPGAKGSLQVAELVVEYKRFEDAERLAVTPMRLGLTERRFTNDVAELLATTISTDDGEDMGEDERSDSEPSGSDTGLPKAQQSLTVGQKRAAKKEVKVEKSINKAAKNQRKHVVTLRREDVENVARTIHGYDYQMDTFQGNPLSTDKTIGEVMKRNLGFVSAIQEHRSFLLRSLAKERDLASKNKKAQSSEHDDAQLADPRVEIDDLVAAVLTKLGIQSASPTLPLKSSATASFATPGNGKKTKVAILQKLSAAIAEDIVNHENELNQTYQRAAGFWRYANHEILVRLTEHAREVDWTTGEKVRKNSGYAEDGARYVSEEAGNGHETLEKSSSDGETKKMDGNKHATVDREDAGHANMLDGLPYDAYSLSVLDYRSPEGIWEYFQRNGKLSDIPGRFIQPAKW